MLDFRGCQMRHEKKQKGIGGDVQVEIDETMHKKATRSYQSRELQGPCKGITELTQALEGHVQQDDDKPGTTKASEKSRLSKGLKVIVVGMVDNLSVVKRFVGGIDDLQGTESRARDRVIQEDSPGVAAHRCALAGGRFKGLQG